MITVGIDAHEDSYTLVAVDDVGKRIGCLTVQARQTGHERLLDWLTEYGTVEIAVEDCRHLTRSLEAALLIAGHRVVRVHTRLMADARRSACERGKSDPIDAEAVARVALREEGLPTATLAGPERDLKLYSDHRKRLVEHRTALQSKLRWFLHELVPDLAVPSRGIKRATVFALVSDAISTIPGAVAEIARDLLDDIIQLTSRINSLEKQLAAIVKIEYPTLLTIPGLGTLGAATIVGETANITRFTSNDAYARFNGTAPSPVWSSNHVRVRLSRGGNRTINAALHMAAVTQLRLHGEGANYLAKQLERGKTKKEALRLLRRRLSDRVYKAMRQDHATTCTPRAAEPIPLQNQPDHDLVIAA
ncbi:IS110 family RNA-guided transposase [Gulosibacter chungangensis]|uniref:IS110 family transposase n=1 Tax=Gulosibacter chungangensis TaxID=979746 RepID=UPI001CE49515|nr:IS110 family transposase [Gulosibacter chungangensis]